jgi:hypothetical protein
MWLPALCGKNSGDNPAAPSWLLPLRNKPCRRSSPAARHVRDVDGAMEALVGRCSVRAGAMKNNGRAQPIQWNLDRLEELTARRPLR